MEAIITVTIVCAALLASALLTPMLSTLYRSRNGVYDPYDGIDDDVDDNAEEPLPDNAKALPHLSIIIVASENGEELRANMPLILAQDYPAGFDIIVVVDKKDAVTHDVLEQLTNENSNVYTTFVPDSSRYMSRRKLAVTLGVKASKGEWIVLTDATCVPATDKWLLTMAENCADDVNLVIGYSNYTDEAKRYQRFERLLRELYLARETREGTAYRTEGTNIMFRKSQFMDGKGYDGNLKYIRGEYDFLINKYAEKHHTAVEMRRKAWILECPPTKKIWLQKRLYDIDTRKHLERSRRHAFLHRLDVFAVHFNYILIILAAVVPTLIDRLPPEIYCTLPPYICLNETARYFIMSCAVAALVITIIRRSIIGGPVVAHFCPNISPWRIVPLEIGSMFHTLNYKFKYFCADKYDFICHKQ